MEKLPATQVLILTALTERDAVIEAVAAGATGCLQKYPSGQELEEAAPSQRGPSENTGRGHENSPGDDPR